MISQPRLLLKKVRLLVFVLLLFSGCTSNDTPKTNDAGIPDKQDVFNDAHEELDIDESPDTSMGPNDSEIQEDAQEEQDSDSKNTDADETDIKELEDVDEEYERKLQELDEFYSTRSSSSNSNLIQYQQWLILQPRFDPLIPPPYLAEFLIYNKNTPHQMLAFSGHPEHHYISNLITRPYILGHHLFILGPGTLETGDDTMVPSLRIYDLDILPQNRVLKEIYLNKPVVGMEPADVHCNSFDKILSEMNFFITKDAAVVICDRQIVMHTLQKDIHDKFYISESKAVTGTTANYSQAAYGHQTSDENIYLVMDSANARVKDVFSLDQDGTATKISELSLPQYEVRGELIQPGFAQSRPEWVGHTLWVPTSNGPFAAVFDMSDPAQPIFLHYTQKFGTLLRIHASGPYVFALIYAASAASFCTEELFDEHCLASKFDVMLYDINSPSPVSSLSNVIKLDTDDDGFDNYSSIGDIVFDDPMLYLTQTHYYAQDESTRRGILQIDLSERLSALSF